jgi:tetratricopeptide (TPR) repeat protein
MEARIGRLLVASLHQAISDVLPDRLEFYENWLNARGLRRGTIGLAAVSAVLSFLRGEGDAYDKVVRRAGEHAADWTLLGVGRIRFGLLHALPRRVRARKALALARRIIRDTYSDSRALTKIRRGVIHVDVRGSLFCEVREAGDRALCGFYLALVQRLLERYNVPATGAIGECRGTGSRGCAMAIRLGPSTARPEPIARLTMAIAAAATLHAAVVVAQVDQPASTERLLVIPFENLEREPALYWLSEGSAILLSDALNDVGATAITRADRVRAFEELHLPLTAVLSRATVIKVGQLVGASRVVMGTIQRTAADGGDGLLVRARSVRLDTGRLEPEVTERAPLDRLVDLFQRVAARLQGQPPGRARERPPLQAFENYVKGLLAQSPESQEKFLQAALRLHPAFDRAHLALWEAQTEAGNDAAALNSARAVSAGSPLSRRARHAAALSLIELARYDEAFDTLKALHEEQPAAALQNNLGVVQIRRGWTAQTGKPAYFFDRAVEADPHDPDHYFNLGYAYALDTDPQAAIYWLRESVRRNPADAEAHFVLAAVLRSAGNTVEAAREQELARQLSADYENLSRRLADTGRVARGLERLKWRLEPFASRVEAAIATPAQRDQREMAAFHLERGRRFFDQQRDREALTELRRAVYLSPYQAEAHLLLGRLYLRTGSVTDAVGALKISIWSEDTAIARVALAEAYLQAGDPAAAREQAERALALAPDSADAKALLSRIR